MKNINIANDAEYNHSSDINFPGDLRYDIIVTVVAKLGKWSTNEQRLISVYSDSVKQYWEHSINRS